MLNSYSIQIKYRPNQKYQAETYTTYEAERKKERRKAFHMLETINCEEASPSLNLKRLSFIQGLVTN